MRLILEIQEQDINPGAPKVDESSYKKREAARAVITDTDGKVALLHVGKHKYHKLPGGGLDPGEDIPTALERELLEEIGCLGNVLSEVGKVIEHKNRFKMVQTSYCFLAELVGEKGQPDFTEWELAREFSVVWANNLDAAIQLLRSDDPDDYEGKFIRKRDLAVLEAAANPV